MIRAFVISILLVACGDNQRPCNYVEKSDGDNDTTPEATGLGIGAATEDLCGTIDGGHFANGIIDVDRFRVSIAGSDMRFQLSADDDVTVLPQGLELRVFDTAVNPTLFAEMTFDPKIADHAAQLVELPGGDYDIVVSAAAGGELSGNIGYRLRVTAFDFGGCTASGAASYTESGSSGGDNDAVAVDYAKTPQFTMMSGTPEATKLAVDAGHAYKISGSASTDAGGDDYLDRDTYSLETDDTTNEMTVDLSWMGDADLDYLVLDPSSLTAIGLGNIASNTGPELATFAVKPSTTYWLWVGRHTGPSTDSSPIAYDATVCPTHYFH